MADMKDKNSIEINKDTFLRLLKEIESPVSAIRSRVLGLMDSDSSNGTADMEQIVTLLDSISETISSLENIYTEESLTSVEDYEEGSVEDVQEDSMLLSPDTMLVVEPDPESRKSLAETFEKDFKIITAVNGKQGLNIAREKSPDIIVSTVMMPLMDGFEMCGILKSSSATSHIPIVLVTGKRDKQSIIHGLEAGANDYILKPYDTNVLYARIHNLLEERQRVREKFLTSNIGGQGLASFTNRLDKEFMNRVMKVVEKELANAEFQIGDFCTQLAMSRTAFYNKLKALTGMGPNDFVRTMRMNKAKALIESRQYNVAEVSDMVGFSDPKYFSICFKKQFNISPSKL